MTENPEISSTGRRDDRREIEHTSTPKTLDLPLAAAALLLPGTGEEIHLSADGDGVFVQSSRGGGGGVIGSAPTWRAALSIAADYIAGELVTSWRVSQ